MNQVTGASMGISYFAASYMADAVHDFGMRGSALTLGRQDVFITHDQLADLVMKTGAGRVDAGRLVLPDPTAQAIVSELYSSGRAFRTHTAGRDSHVSDELLFVALGFESCSSVDFSPYEGATFVHDLNHPDISRSTGRRFDFVFDGGTTEHVFHVPHLFGNIFDSLNIGGHVMHASPSNNHCDHGFYQLSPTLFCDWYVANKWIVKRADFFRYTKAHDVEPWVFTPYTPGSLDAVSFGGLDSAMYGTMFCAEKTAESTWTTIPQQNSYRRVWTVGNKQGG